MPSRESAPDNFRELANPAVLYAFSVCLCMSCAMSEKDGAGLGTLGFTVSVANRMLREGGFAGATVLFQDETTRWYEVY